MSAAHDLAITIPARHREPKRPAVAMPGSKPRWIASPGIRQSPGDAIHRAFDRFGQNALGSFVPRGGGGVFLGRLGCLACPAILRIGTDALAAH